MSAIERQAAGSFCGAELQTTDARKASSFYAELFNWTPKDHVLPQGGVYTLLQCHGLTVAALYEVPAIAASEAKPKTETLSEKTSERAEKTDDETRWVSYISVPSVDASCVRAQTLGGRLTRAASDVFDLGRVANIQDPTGARVALWEPRIHFGAEVSDELGSMCWNELCWHRPCALDTQRALTFYQELFGWTEHTQVYNSESYTTLVLDKVRIGGVTQVKCDLPHWMVYFAVKDCEAASQFANRLGAQTLTPPRQIADIGRGCILQDPQGAAFGVMSLRS